MKVLVEPPQKHLSLEARIAKIAADPNHNAISILEERFGKLDDDFVKMENEREFVGQQIFDLRESANLSQEELGNKVGMTADDIDSLEMADYEEHPFQTLRKIADVFGKKIEIRFV